MGQTSSALKELFKTKILIIHGEINAKLKKSELLEEELTELIRP